MLAARIMSRCSTRALSTSLSYQGGSGGGVRSTIKPDNEFWMRHQREAKPGFNKEMQFERFVSMGLLAALPLSAIMPGTFVLDTAVSTFVVFHLYHGMYGMIADYIPLIMPEAVVGPLQPFWFILCFSRRFMDSLQLPKFRIWSYVECHTSNVIGK